MKIKKTRQLQLGDRIKWDKMSYTSDELNGHRAIVTLELIVTAVYPEFVAFRNVEPPHTLVNITNNELYTRGIYKETDFIRPFA